VFSSIPYLYVPHASVDVRDQRNPVGGQWASGSVSLLHEPNLRPVSRPTLRVAVAFGEMSSKTRITGLGRTLSPSLRSHRFVLGSALAAGVFYAMSSVVTYRSLSDSVVAAVAVFLAWAVGRELDPDRPQVGVWAMPVAFAALIYDLPSALSSAVALIAIRVVAGTTGGAVTWVDVVVLAFVGFLAASDPVLWIVGLTLAIWLFTAPEVGVLRIVGLSVLGIGVGIGVWFTEPAVVEITQDAYLLAAFAGGAMMLAMTPKSMTSVTDTHSGPLSVHRVGLARKTAGTFIMWAALMGGVAGFWMLSPLLAALIATAFAKWFSAGA
jgi:hypothetical protein